MIANERKPGTTGSTTHREDSAKRGNDANRYGSGQAVDQRDEGTSKEVERMVSEGGQEFAGPSTRDR